MQKLIYTDVETTGLFPGKHDIIQLSGIIEIDNKEVDRFDYHVQPFSYENIDKKALEHNGKTIEDLKTYLDPEEAYVAFTTLLSKHVDKYNKNDKFYIIGYKGDFDLRFMHEFWKKNNDKYFGSFFNWRVIDPIYLIDFLEIKGELNIENRKLKTICDHFNIEINPHEAMSDIKATRTLFKQLLDRLEFLPA